jgi:aspartyl-tRNA(Asn)/glutamyl-tRNA(Gln) amidotransferase subunit C
MVTKEEIQKIAILSKLSVSEEELESLTADMAQIIAFADTINAASEESDDFDNINHLSNVFREDVVVPSYDREKILQNVGGGEEGYFPVKKIV